MAFCSIDLAKQRLPVTDAGVNYENVDIQNRIERAEAKVKTYLATQFDNATITGWNIVSDNVPDEVAELTADIAAAFMYQDFYGQSLTNGDTVGGGLFLNARKELERIANGEKEILVNTTEERISPIKPEIAVSTSNQERQYTQRDSDGEVGGTLANW
jgi:hypothetical protein